MASRGASAHRRSLLARRVVLCGRRRCGSRAFFRRHAAWQFEAALSSYDGAEREERAVLTYLVGELWRRVGDLSLANEWFDRVESEVMDPAAQRWVLDAAWQQRSCPRDWFE